jgi:hypothetical protein
LTGVLETVPDFALTESGDCALEKKPVLTYARTTSGAYSHWSKVPHSNIAISGSTVFIQILKQSHAPTWAPQSKPYRPKVHELQDFDISIYKTIAAAVRLKR